jgi:rhamnogalacturonyl hydrolase YesR
MYLDVYREKQEPEIINHFKWVLDDHLRRKPKADVRFDGNPYAREWWSWCDALFMAPPAFAKMWQVTGKREYLEYGIEHWLITTNYLWDVEEDLIYRDDRFFDARTSSGQKVFWSRGNGWVFAGLAHMLDMIPNEHPKRSRFIDQFKGMAEILAGIQGEDGMWRPSLLDAEEFPQPETSGSAFFCYGMLWGMNNGLLSRDEFEPVVVKAWNALVQQVNEEGRLGHVQPPGKEPKDYTGDEWHEYGTGAFLLAGSELLNTLGGGTSPESFRKGKQLYENTFAAQQDVSDWIMEGPGKIEFRENWMHLYSPKEEGHHVFWCPEDLPASFISEWELQNIETDAGLCIIFFAAKGINGEDIFDPAFPERDGTFRQYTRSKHFNNYHISYYANGKDKPAREISHLRKNSGFNKVQIGEPGIPVESKAIHKMKLIARSLTGQMMAASMDPYWEVAR